MNIVTKFRILLLSLLGAACLFITVPVLAIDCSSSNLTTQEALQCGTNGASGGQNPTPKEATNKFNNILSDLLNILTVLVGVVAVIMIIMSGFRFTTSGGNPDKIKSARSALMYAVIGIIVAALAQLIVKFVLNRAITAKNTSQVPTAIVIKNS